MDQQPPPPNPRFAAPAADVSPVPELAGEFETAGPGRRFLNFVFDYVVFVVLSMVLGVVLAVIGQADLIDRMGKLGSNVLFIALYLGYYFGCELLLGRTPGKFVTRTAVISDRGGPPSVGQLIKRTLIRLVPFEFLSAFRGSRLMWHDSGSDTRVVVKRS